MLWLRDLNEDEDMHEDEKENVDDVAELMDWQLAWQAWGLRGVGITLVADRFLRARWLVG